MDGCDVQNEGCKRKLDQPAKDLVREQGFESPHPWFDAPAFIDDGLCSHTQLLKDSFPDDIH